MFSVCVPSDAELLHISEDNVWSPQLLGECLGHAGTVQVSEIYDLSAVVTMLTLSYFGK